MSLEPETIERDETGYWMHPQYNMFFDQVDTEEEYCIEDAFMLLHDLEHKRILMQNVAHEQSPEWCEYENQGTFADGILIKPNGDGWFLLAVTDSDDGPEQVWVRPA